MKRPSTYNKVRFAMHWKLSRDLLEHRLDFWHSLLLLDLGGQASRQQWHAKGSLQNRFRAYAFRYQEMRGDNVPKAHTMRKTANDESGISNLSSVDFAKNLAYSDLTVGLKVCVSSLETQRGYALTDERD